MTCKMAVCVLTHFFAASVCAAGVVSGGGGRGVFCDDPQHHQHGRLLDIYEGESLFGWPQANQSMTKEQALEFFAKRLNEVLYNPASNDTFEEEKNGLKEAFSWWQKKNFKFINPGDRLAEVQDSFEPVIPNGCSIRQIANFYDNKMVLVDPTLWGQMSPFDQVGLIVHELLYKDLRDRGHTNSVYARYLVGQVASLAPLNGLTEILSKVSVSYRCESVPGDFPDHVYEFYVYPECVRDRCFKQFKFVYVDSHWSQFLEPIDVGGSSFDYFGKEQFITTFDREVYGQKLWFRIEGTTEPFTLKIATSPSDSKDAFVSTVKCVKFENKHP